MAFTVLTMASDIYAFLKRPSEQELPLDDLLAVISRKVNELLLLAQLSDKNYLAALTPTFTFNGTDRTKVLSFDEISSIVRVESRSIGSDENGWSEEKIVDYGAWNDAEDSIEDSVAFFGNPVDGLTMAVNRDASNLEFRIMFETGGISLAGLSAQVPLLQDFFKAVLFYGSCAEAAMMQDGLNAEGEKSRNQTVAYLLSQQDTALTNFKRWLLNSPGQSVVFRQAFNDSRFGSGQTRMSGNDWGGGSYYSRY